MPKFIPQFQQLRQRFICRSRALGIATGETCLQIGFRRVVAGNLGNLLIDRQNPSSKKGADNPVERVSWIDAEEFCARLSEKEGVEYRLPTEAEWEYACRGGTTTKYSFGDDRSQLRNFAWYEVNDERRHHPVGQKKPNPWGLYDMHGNVWEWCQDWYGDYPSGSTTDPTGAASGSYRVNRGGSWGHGAGYCRSARRYRYYPSYRSSGYGFRVCLESVWSVGGA
jgi:formylglycine-generating enzyme required for sulfatase activity